MREIIIFITNAAETSVMHILGGDGMAVDKNSKPLPKGITHRKDGQYMARLEYQGEKYTYTRPKRKNIMYLQPEEIEVLHEVLDSDLVYALSLRNKAIGTLLLFTGLWACNIAGLTLDEIDWEKDEIRIVQNKTDVPLVLPLSAMVGNALYDYITLERPGSDDPHIFLGANRPHDPITAGAIWLIQEMVDEWCMQRDTETSTSCYTRTLIVREFIDYLHCRSMTEVRTPKAPKLEKRKYIPHAFTDEELSRFFEKCDSIIPYKGRRASVNRKHQCPVFFRLLYSSGIRTTEARYLKREDVDLTHGVLNIRKSKGYDQHYVALHETMTKLLARYDVIIDKIQPNRIYFFESMKGGCYGRDWVNDNFKKLWEAANGSAKGMIPYDVRHHYAIENISSWEDDSFTFGEKLHYLSKSMGHRWIKSTLYYYSIVPSLADKIEAKTETGFNEIVPEVWNEED